MINIKNNKNNFCRNIKIFSYKNKRLKNVNKLNKK
jgi:hypothetical protein